ncbi:NAD(P)/FAD-dependent oxidoreductase [Candidatus Uabimicrobium amorphum]|uniref:Monooxygenase n=1 Tax=Uabimicrobium amorphum TaxID=2596890 RepID=A0A5S9IJR3_UABAM|nr:NAD(P)/FAD-dependent oxidoreductase [Candidatus Uabimicrobium amorphum]BBM83123.1 monooxygenase [Candidatus Uabimicrobium amorphum]
MRKKNKEFDVIIVGAGAAGLGVAIVLKKLGINHVILEKHSVGSSFKKWPKETRFISPSFTGNFFKMPDLNAISPKTSPAFNLLTEHPSGKEFARYLEGIAKFYKLPVETNIEVKTVQDKQDFFSINTSNGEYKSKFVIWAAGEYQYPRKMSFQGDHHCTHYSEISSFSDIKGEDCIVIGGYESGFDATVHLVKSGKKVTLIDASNYLNVVNSDSSYSLSPFTRDRVREVANNYTYHKNTKVQEVKFDKEVYVVKTTKKTFTTKNKPINCTGFMSSLFHVQELFNFKDGYPILNNYDESTRTNNLFLVGPQVKHRNALFCFIYKYRQRFAIVAETIAKRNKISRKLIKEILHEYQDGNFYLEDLSCCDEECTC